MESGVRKKVSRFERFGRILIVFTFLVSFHGPQELLTATAAPQEEQDPYQKLIEENIQKSIQNKNNPPKKKSQGYSRNNIIVKFKDDAIVGEVVEDLFKNRQKFKTITDDDGLDKLSKKYKVRKVTRMFKDLDKKDRRKLRRLRRMFQKNLSSQRKGKITKAKARQWHLKSKTDFSSQVDFIKKKRKKRNKKRKRRQQNISAESAPYLKNVYKMEFTDAEDIFKAIQDFENDPSVAYAQPDYEMELVGVPNDPRYIDMWGLEKIEAPTAWDLSEGEGVIVAVNDTGIDSQHPDIMNNLWVNDDPVDGIDNDGNGYIDDTHGWDFVSNDGVPYDGHGHGTHVAGTIAAEGNNNLGVIGVAPKAKIMSMKVLSDSGSGFGSDVAAGIMYAADNGADVINNSLGCGAPCPSNPLSEDAVRYATNLGVAVVYAAGNAATNVNQYSPQNMSETFTIGASTSIDSLASFSNYGAGLDIVAPGTNILSLDAGTNGYVSFNGTSMACPHAAGAIALLLSYDPALSLDQVRQALHEGSDDLGDPGFDPTFGHGRLNLYKTLEGSSQIGRGVRARITEPSGKITGVTTVNIVGTATANDFSSWSLDYQAAGSPNWNNITTSTTQADDDILAVLNIENIPDGNYLLRLTVTLTDQTQFSDFRSMNIDQFVLTEPQSEKPVFLNDGNNIITFRGTVAPSNLDFFSVTAVRLSDNQIFTSDDLNVNYFNNGIDRGTEKVVNDLLAEFDTQNFNATNPDNYIVYFNVFTIDENTLDVVLEAEEFAYILDPTLLEGWPKQLPAFPFALFGPRSPKGHLTSSDINQDGQAEIVLGYGEEILVYDYQGNLLPGWPQKINEINNSAIMVKIPAVGDLTGDGYLELAAGNSKSEIYVYDYQGNILPGWPRIFGEGRADPVISDLDFDGKNEIILFGKEFLDIVDVSGQSLIQGPITNDWDGSTFPSIGDLDNDGEQEIVFTYPGLDRIITVYRSDGSVYSNDWPIPLYYPPLPPSPVFTDFLGGTNNMALGDLDGDKDLEIVIGNSGFVEAYHHDGSTVTGWPQQLFDPTPRTGDVATVGHPIIADLDNDGSNEIIVGTGVWTHWIPKGIGGLYVFRADGTLMPGWPYSIQDSAFGPPIVVDINNDGFLNIVIEERGTNAIKAFDINGQMISGFPKPTPYTKRHDTLSPAVDDFDGDGLLEMAHLQWNGDGNGSHLYLWDTEAPVSVKRPWPMFRNSPGLTGLQPVSPTFRMISDKVVLTDRPLNFEVTTNNHQEQPFLLFASLANDDPLSSISATFTDNRNNTGTFEWIPTASQVGDYVIKFTLRDSRDNEDSTLVMVSVLLDDGINFPPTIGAVSDQTVTIPNTLDITIPISDPDQDPFSVTLSLLNDSPVPPFVNFSNQNDGNYLFSANPKASDSGTYSFKITADDGVEITEEVFQVIINQTPTIGAISDKTLIIPEELNILVPIDDPDNDLLTVTLLQSDDSPAPSFISLSRKNSDQYQIVGSPTITDAGTYSLKVIVDDGILTVEENFQLIVNQQPIIGSISDQSITVPESYGVNFSVVDSDYSSLTVSLLRSDDSPAPSFLNLIDQGNGNYSIQGTPTEDDVNIHFLKIVADDQVSNTKENFQLTVNSEFAGGGGGLFLSHFDQDPFVDDSNNHTITKRGAVRMDVSDKKFGAGSLQVSGDGEYLELSNNGHLNLGMSDFTMDFWVKFDSMENVDGIISQFDNWGNRWRIELSGDSGKRIRFQSVANGSGSFYVIASNHGITPGNWYHIAIVKTSTQGYLFVNGIDRTVAFDNEEKAFPNVASPIYIGKGHEANHGMQGRVDELRITDNAEWTSNFTPPTAAYSAGPAPSPNGPTASFTISDPDRIVNVNSNLIFDASRSRDPENEPLTYSWDFDDNNTNSSERVFHRFSNGGIYDVTLTVTDPNNESDSITKAVRVNHNPTLTLSSPLPNETFQAGDTIRIIADAADQDDKITRVTFRAYDPQSNPAWYFFDDDTEWPYVHNWTNVPVGNYRIYVSAYDETNSAQARSVSVSITPRNQSPTIGSISDQTIEIPNSLNVTVPINDPESDPLTVVLVRNDDSPRPGFINFVNQNNGTYLISGTPTDSDVGTYSLKIVADDGNNTVEEVFQLTVDPTPPNRAPVIDPISDQTIAVPTGLNINFSINDPEDDSLTVSLTGINNGPRPGFINFAYQGNQNYLISGVPTDSDVGTYNLEVTADDGEDVSTETFQLIVDPRPPRAPDLFLTHFDSDPFIDASNNHTITKRGAVRMDVSDKKFGAGSLQVSGDGEYLELSNNGHLNLGMSDFTMDFWVKFDSMENVDGIISQFDNWGNRWRIELSGDSGKRIRFQSVANGSGSFYVIASNHGITPGNWYHIAIVKTSTQGYLFVNGIDRTVAFDNEEKAFPNVASPIYIGKGHEANHGMQGRVDELRITDNAEWTSNFTPPAAPYGSAPPPQNQIPVADLGSPTAQDLTLTYNGTASSDPDNDPLTYSWDFGDGNTSTQASGNYTYQQAGTYTVALTVNDGTDNSTPVSTNVTVTDPPPGNQAPSVGSVTDQTVTVPNALNVTVPISDPDNDPLTVTLTRNDDSPRPNFINFQNQNNGNYLISGTPQDSDAGTYQLKITADDGADTTTVNFQVTVNPTPTPTSSLLLTHFDQDPFVDDSNNHTITKRGAVRMDVSDKKFGAGSLQVSGDGEYLELSNNGHLNLGMSDFTMDFWVKFDSMENVDGIISQFDNWGNRWRIELSGDSGKRIRFQSVANGSGSFYVIASNHGITPGNWYHIAIVKTSTQGYLFVNGIDRTVAFDNEEKAFPNVASPIYIGKGHEANHGMQGRVDELRITDNAEWTSNFTPPSVPYGGPAPNQAPTIESIADQTIAALDSLNVSALISDPDNDPLTVTLTRTDDSPAPSFINCEDQGGGSYLLSGNSTVADEGTHNLKVSVSDGINTTEQTFDLIITPRSGQPPVIGELTTITVTAPDPINVLVPISDPEGDPLTVTLTRLGPDPTVPAFISFTDQMDGNHLLSGIPSAIWETYSLRITADDGTGTTEEDFLLTILPSGPPLADPHTPFIGTIADQVVTIPGSLFAETFVADLDGGDDLGTLLDITLTLDNDSPAPAFISLNEIVVRDQAIVKLELTGTPAPADTGVYNLKISADDNEGNTSSMTFQVTVN